MTASTLEVGDNVVAFLLSVGGAVCLILGLSIAALAMSGLSALVAVDALLLKRTRFPGSAAAARPWSVTVGLWQRSVPRTEAKHSQ